MAIFFILDLFIVYRGVCVSQYACGDQSTTVHNLFPPPIVLVSRIKFRFDQVIKLGSRVYTH